MAKIHKEAEPRNRKHTVKTDMHKKGHTTIKVHKTGGRKKHGSKKTILK
jgi:hypothetical protein